MVVKAKAREVDTLEGGTFNCWKCELFSKDQKLFNNHMTWMHMMGVVKYQEMKHLEAVSSKFVNINSSGVEPIQSREGRL